MPAAVTARPSPAQAAALRLVRSGGVVYHRGHPIAVKGRSARASVLLRCHQHGWIASTGETMTASSRVAELTPAGEAVSDVD